MVAWMLSHTCQAWLLVAVAALVASGGCSSRTSAGQTDASTASKAGNGAQPVAPPSDAGHGAPQVTPPSDAGAQLDAGKTLVDASRTSDDADSSSPDDAAAAQDGGMDTGMILGPPIEAPKPSGCVTDVSAGVHDFTCDTTIDTVSVPEACTKRSCGVIVDVHGGMMSSQMEDKNTGLRALGVEHGFIVIQPNALQNVVLLNQRLYVADTPMTPADDTRVMDILTQVIDVFHADKKRIHMTGFSEGGFMSWRWFCAHSDLLASVAPGAAAWKCGVLANAGLTPPEVGCELSGNSLPAHNIPVLYVQGMKDGLIDPKCADGWVRSNAFSALKLGTGTTLAGDPNFQSAPYVRTRYLDPQGVPFEYIQHQYTSDSSFLGVGIVGHCYPGSTDLMVTPPAQTIIQPDQLMSFGCKDKCDFNWGEEVIKFFMAHPKP
jgi:pimeloyl-ACP methyl ester carboxylesterase